MSTGMTKEVNQMIRQLRKLGCSVAVTGSGHWWVGRPGRRPVTIAKSPSDQRTVRNAKADVKRYLGITL